MIAFVLRYQRRAKSATSGAATSLLPVRVPLHKTTLSHVCRLAQGWQRCRRDLSIEYHRDIVERAGRGSSDFTQGCWILRVVLLLSCRFTLCSDWCSAMLSATRQRRHRQVQRLACRSFGRSPLDASAEPSRAGVGSCEFNRGTLQCSTQPRA